LYVAPCRLAETDGRGRRVEVQLPLMIQAANICEKSVNFYQTILNNIPEDSLILAKAITWNLTGNSLFAYSFAEVTNSSVSFTFNVPM
jgi:hypothetical protein